MYKKILCAICLFLLIISAVGCAPKSIGKAHEGVLNDVVVIDNNDLKECCLYQDALGNEKRCNVIERYNCSYCDKYCNK